MISVQWTMNVSGITVMIWLCYHSSNKTIVSNDNESKLHSPLQEVSNRIVLIMGDLIIEVLIGQVTRFPHQLPPMYFLKFSLSRSTLMQRHSMFFLQHTVILYWI